jgi:mannosyltransferase OCH1-like enzyme
MIPHIFHWVWLGDNPIPYKDKEWMSSWVKHHPEGWRFIVHAEHPSAVELPEKFEVRQIRPLISQWAYDHVEQVVHQGAGIAARSDIVRYEVVLEGGIYLDTDVECFAPIDRTIENVTLFVSDQWGPSTGSPGNYMFGATPNHPAIYTVVRDMDASVRRPLDEQKTPASVLQVTGPNYLNHQLSRYASELVIFPYQLFSPLDYVHDPDSVEVWPEASLGNHRADGKWYDRVKVDAPAKFKKRPRQVKPDAGANSNDN